ncbi:TolC family protein [Segatella sp.]|uniref:TolC family protein n=1 Tax=Segatella sp. TaxID=2974253 RepID=UPI00307EA8F9
MKKYITLIMLMGALIPAGAQAQTLSLDSCRAMALRNNKQLNASKLKKDMAYNMKKSARTKYLPKVDALGGYEWFSREISLLNDGQKSTFSNIGSTITGGISGGASNLMSQLVSQGMITPEIAQQIGGLMNEKLGPLQQQGNALGEKLVDAFRTDTRNIWAGSVMVRQPIYMGGAIIAANKIADIGEQIAENDLDQQTQSTLYSIDQAYWLAVSLKQKQKLAISYRDLVKKLNEDVHKMIQQGVATKADGLKVDVKVNEAEMQITQAEDGLALSKMLLCQLCGIPMNQEITLADEDKETLALSGTPVDTEQQKVAAQDSALNTRPELRMLQNALDISKEATNMVRAINLPHVMLTGGYMISNPNVFNGFQKKFTGVWNVGVMVHVPVWNWFDGAYKVRAAKAASNIAQMNLDDTREKIHLQITQSQFKVKEAQKKLNMAMKNIASADENLRCANLGFKEGVMEVTDVMAAQTAWQKAQSQKIDAEIDVKLTQVGLNKALGILQ